MISIKLQAFVLIGATKSFGESEEEVVVLLGAGGDLLASTKRSLKQKGQVRRKIRIFRSHAQSTPCVQLQRRSCSSTDR